MIKDRVVFNLAGKKLLPVKRSQSWILVNINAIVITYLLESFTEANNKYLIDPVWPLEKKMRC